MKIQFFSDIHLEFGDYEIPATDADVIVAAGDIGVGTQGIEWLRQFERPTIYVAGNHEYYGGDLVHTRALIAEACRDSNIHFLENARIELDGVRFLGATLWTDYANGNPDLMASAQRQMNDYLQIRCASGELSPEQIYDINCESRFWLARELDQSHSGPTVVVTHHAPSTRSWPYVENEGYRASYCNELDDVLYGYDIDVWIHGHVHCVADYSQANTRILCNPRGYTGYQTIEAFSGEKTVDV